MTEPIAMAAPANEHLVAKGATAAAAAAGGWALTDWSQFAGLVASVLAGVYSAILIIEWVWKHILRKRAPFDRRKALAEVRARRRHDDADFETTTRDTL